MTTKTFRHSFYPWHKDPAPGGEVELSVEAIEAAGVREVLQMPGAVLGSWSLLDALLAKCDEFRFLEPLGQAREVKVALSGLFGRFVARAYLERYCGLQYFAHLGGEEIELGRRRRVRVVRCRGQSGDLPDWVACAGDLTNVTVAEAKGSHAWSGPGSAMTQARKQVARVDVHGAHGRMTVKRVAVATRWGMVQGGPPDSWIKVHDPEDEGDVYTAEEADTALLGIVRLHMANLFARLGRQELSVELRALTTAPTEAEEAAAGDRAPLLIEQASEAGRRLRGGRPEAIGDAVVGGVVTRAGALGDRADDEIDVAALARLDLRPVFVGVSPEAVSAAIAGSASGKVMRRRRTTPTSSRGWCSGIAESFRGGSARASATATYLAMSASARLSPCRRRKARWRARPRTSRPG